MKHDDATVLQLKRRIKELETILKMRFVPVRKVDLVLVEGQPTPKELLLLEMTGEKLGIQCIVCDDAKVTFSLLDDETLESMGLRRISVDGGIAVH